MWPPDDVIGIRLRIGDTAGISSCMASKLDDVAVTYFTFDVNGRHTGLIRRTETSDELTLERMDPAGRWVDDSGLVRHFRDSVDLVKLRTALASANH